MFLNAYYLFASRRSNHKLLRAMWNYAGTYVIKMPSHLSHAYTCLPVWCIYLPHLTSRLGPCMYHISLPYLVHVPTTSRFHSWSMYLPYLDFRLGPYKYLPHLTSRLGLCIYHISLPDLVRVSTTSHFHTWSV